MKSQIEKTLKESLSCSKRRFEKDVRVRQFEETKRVFDDLVSKGFARERGNNLLSISDKNPSTKVVFNSK